MIFITGCPPAKPKALETSTLEPNEVQPAQIEPNDIVSIKIEPDEVEPNEIELDIIEPNIIEPNKAESIEIEPNQLEPNEVEPIEIEPNDVETPLVATFHEKCTDILNKFVNKKGMVDYRTLKLKRQELESLLNEFATLDPNEYKRWSKEDKIAFWINAYNIQLLNIIVQNYPIKLSGLDTLRFWWPPTSIRYIDKDIGGIARQKFIIMDEEFTLSEIDRRFFRKEFDEPRIFFAISHASLSSPPLRNEPYYGHKLYEQLDDQTKKFLASPLAFKIDRKDKKAYLSAILQSSWYGKQFTNKYSTDKKFKDQQPDTQAVLNFITNYISSRDVSFLELENYTVKYINYDWRLNDSSE